MILGGDFNVDFMRKWSHTELLVDFCSRSDLFRIICHNNSVVDYTYYSQIRFFTSIDHFIVSEKLFMMLLDLSVYYMMLTIPQTMSLYVCRLTLM